MPSSSSPSDIYAKTLAVFDQTEYPHEPLTTPEVAEALECKRRTVYKRLETLVTREELKTKKVGAGARVWWPAEDSTLHSDSPEPSAKTSPSFSPGHVIRDSIRVLHVDDNPKSGVLVTEHLESEDDRIETVTATSVTAGLDILADQPIDCIVSDYEMPRRDGIDFLEAVREDYGDVPFILLTGRGSEGIAAEAIEAGVDSYHQKERGTDHYTVLANRIHNLVEQHRERARADRLEEEYALAAETATDIFWVHDLTAETVKMDGLHRFGYDSADIDPDFEWWIERLHPDDRERMRQVQNARLARDEDVFDELTADRGEFSTEYRFQRADGSYADCTSRGVLLFDDGEPVKMVGTSTDITARKQRERDLQQYKTITQTVSDVVVTIDTDSVIQEVNPAVADIFGYERTEVLGESLTTLMPDSLTDTHRDGIQRYLREGERNIDWDYIELPGIRADGTEISLAISFSEYEHDSEHYFTGIIRDISERKEREWKLQRYEQIIEALGDPVYELDPQGQFTYVNKALAEVSGYEADELLGQHVSFGMDADAISRTESLIAELLAEDPAGHVTLEYEVTTKDGEQIPVENNISLLLDADGRMQGSVGVLRDITTQKKREQSLRDSRDQVELLIDAVEEYAIFRLDPDGNIESWNTGAEQIKGYTEDEIIGQHFSTFYPDDAIAEGVPDQLLTQACEAGSVEDEGWRVRSGGSRFWANVTITALRDEDGLLRGFVKVTRDMTERKDHERELQAQYEHLAALNSLNEVVTGITEAVIEQSTREEIEQVVCEQLAASDSYKFCWIAEADPNTGDIQPRTEIGVDGYLKHIDLSADPDQPMGQGPAGQTFRTGEMQVSRNVFEDPAFEPWRAEADQYGFNSFAAIPIVHEGTQYGVIGVYSERTGAFTDAERNVVGQVGEIIGHAIAAVDRERRYNAIFNQTFQFIGLLEPDGTVLEANETALSFGGLDRNDVIGKPFWEAGWWQLSEQTQDQLKAAIERAAAGEFVRYEVDVQGENSIMPIDFSIQPITNEHGEVELLIPEGRDITERKEREEQLERLDELNTVIRTIEQTVAQSESRDEIAQTICDTLLEFDAYQFAVIGEFSPSFDDFDLWTVTGGGEAYFEDILETDAGPRLSESLGATAAKTGEFHAYQNLAENPYDHWRDVVAKHGIQSYAAIPLVYQDTVHGVIGLYADQPGAFDKEKRRVLSELGEIIGYALYALERKEVLNPTIELEFRSEEIAQPFLEQAEGPIDLNLDSVVPLSDGQQLQYWTITGLSTETVRSILTDFPTVLETRFLSTVGETVRYEVTADVGSIASIFATFDGEFHAATIEDSTCTLVGEFSETVDPEAVTQAVRKTYPDIELASQRRILTSTYLRQMVDDQLTERQRTVLRMAYSAGFYGQPRLSTGEELADRLGITKQTFHHHLRKAEAMVFRHLFDKPQHP